MNQKELIIDKNWDVLIILDACRYDYFEKNYLDYFEGDLRKAKSEGHKTPEFLAKTFDCEFPETIYISANPYINSYGAETRAKKLWGFDSTEVFYKIVDIWEEEHFDKKFGTVPPKPVGKATRMERAKNPDKKIISHFMQPHSPYLTFNMNRVGVVGGIKQVRGERSVDSLDKIRFKLGHFAEKVVGRELVKSLRTRLGFRKLSENELIAKEYGEKYLHEVYEENLRLALEEVKKTVERLPDETVIITSDHGELLGEGGDYGHGDLNNPFLQNVPWFRVNKTI